MIRTAGTRARRLWLCAAATSLLALPAAAQTAAGSQVVNDQLQGGDVIANGTLHVESADAGVTGQAVALGNAATAVGQNQDLAFTSTQRVGAVYVGANPVVQVDGSGGALVTTTASATGNTATAGTCCGQTSGMTTQAVDAGAIIAANGDTEVGALTGQISADATAIGNTQGWEAANGALNVQSVQTQAGHVAADTGVSALGGTEGEGGHTATAVSNDVTIAATASPIEATVSQSMTGDVTHAAVAAYQLGADTGVTQATATGNNVTASTDGGQTVDMYASQDDRGAVEAQSDLKLNSWNTASSGAYGVGNSVLVTNEGPTTSVGVDQFQGADGPVTAQASFTGYSGGDAQANATAVGNAVSVYACASCNGGVEATTNQQTNAPVHATSTVTAGAVNSAFSGASAVGNTATFQVRSAGG